MNRRAFLRAGFRSGVAVTALGFSSCTGPRPNGSPPEGRQGRTLAEAFDREMVRFMSDRRIPGGALAVVRDGKLLYARGYGWADRELRTVVTPQSLFRIASVSKPFTAVAVLKLVEAGRLTLDARALEAMTWAGPGSGPGSVGDERMRRITIRQLLQHTGGWDREVSFDPMFRPVAIARALGVPAPAGARDVIRYMMDRRLDFEPGSRYAYSNFGFCVLGRILEHVTGLPYETAVRENVLTPCGIRGMRLGTSLEPGRAPGEVRYYTRDDSRVTPVFPHLAGKVPSPYGGFHLEAMDAHGGWIASAVDLARFVAMLGDAGHSRLLGAAPYAAMIDPPSPPAWRSDLGRLAAAYYGCGWMVRPDPKTGRVSLWHSGSLPGTATLVVRRRDGLGWVALFNQRSTNSRWPDTAIDPALHRAAAAVRTWPDHDLFASFEKGLE